MTLTKKQRREVYLYAYSELEKGSDEYGYVCGYFSEYLEKKFGGYFTSWEAVPYFHEFKLFDWGATRSDTWFSEHDNNAHRLTALAFCIAMTED